MSEEQAPGGPPQGSSSDSTEDLDKRVLVQGAVIGGIVLIVLIAALMERFSGLARNFNNRLIISRCKIRFLRRFVSAPFPAYMAGPNRLVHYLC